MKEFELRIPVAKWLLSRGLSPVLECQSLNNCDIVGIRFEKKPMRLTDLVAVELKISDFAGVIRQCESHALWPVPEVWAAMPEAAARRHPDWFSDRGIGLLSIDGNSCVVVEPATRRVGCELQRWKNLIRRREEYVWRMKDPLMLRRPAMKQRLIDLQKTDQDKRMVERWFTEGSSVG